MKSDRYSYWWVGISLSVVTFVFGAGGATAVTQHDVSRHEKQIETLSKQVTATETMAARIDERLLHIEQDLSDIKGILKQRHDSP